MVSLNESSQAGRIKEKEKNKTFKLKIALNL